MCRRKGAGDSVSVVSLAGGVVCPKEKRIARQNQVDRCSCCITRCVYFWSSRAFFSREHTLRTTHTSAAAARRRRGNIFSIGRATANELQWILRGGFFSFYRFYFVICRAIECVRACASRCVCSWTSAWVDCFSVDKYVYDVYKNLKFKI